MSASKKSSKVVKDSSQLPTEEFGSPQMIIVPNKGEKISPLQNKFNQLIKDIDLFERAIVEQEHAFDILRQKLAKSIIPLEKEMVACLIDTLKLLSEYIDDPFFTKKHKDFFLQFICDRINEIPEEVFEDPEYGPLLESIIDKHSLNNEPLEDSEEELEFLASLFEEDMDDIEDEKYAEEERTPFF